MKPAELILANQHRFTGLAPAWQKTPISGEVVFTTGMTGYVESLTDPSYAGQILTFTYPLIGNYGVPTKTGWESKKIWARGVVVSQACLYWSHAKSKQSLLSWLQKQRVPVITGVDTRAVTKILRERGVMLGAIVRNTDFVKNPSIALADPNAENLVAEVSPGRITTYGRGIKKIIAVDCGLKENIIRCLRQFNSTVYRVPYDYDYTSDNFDAVFLSNGPGDPAMCAATVQILKKAMTLKKPIFGICLGSQLMTLAAGGKTYKLPYGHRGQNQPCREENTGRCIITSQNHGYAINEKTLPKNWRVTYRNLNDGSVEGIAHKTLPFFSVQFHPEANPGPTDARDLFKKFYSLL